MKAAGLTEWVTIDKNAKHDNFSAKAFFLMFRFLYSLVGGIVFILICLGLAYSYAQSLYTGPGPLQSERLILVPQGAGLNLIAQKLENEHIIRNKYLFILGAKLEDQQTSLKAGEYLIPAQSSAKDVLEIIAMGRVYLRQFTIAEGLTSSRIVEILAANDDLSGNIAPIPSEGSILPETYRYQFGDKRQEQINIMQAAMKKTLDYLWDQREPNLPIKSKAEAVILASIVEKETGVASERKKVAGVFINRLRTGMPLQSDPTVIYAITGGKAPLGRPLYRKDWKTVSPYNTYMNRGLPPAPICNPGQAALAAVLQPEKHNYYYFVADGSGGHAFAVSLAEHNRNVTQWRKIRDQKKTAP